MAWLLLLVALIGIGILLSKLRAANTNIESQKQENDRLAKAHKSIMEQLEFAEKENQTLRPFRDIRDLVATKALLKSEADKIKSEAEAWSEAIKRKANEEHRNIQIKVAELNNEVIRLTESAAAIKNVIAGYGDEYILPTRSLLDELAERFGYDDAGKALSDAREKVRQLISSGQAGKSDYSDIDRNRVVTRLLVDAFNGRVDGVLSKVKDENIGKLDKSIRDFFLLTNEEGKPFNNARITQEYLLARLDELKWAGRMHLLKEQEKEEQRRIREQLREEEKAQLEIERALKEAAKEEETLRKAMEKVQAQVAKASEDQKAEFESKLAELQGKLTEAETRNQRALSMAQQTKAGHVYVISNVGSFGESVFKVGMTRRLEPLDRIRELGDASVPFAFDVHAMIWSEDAPKLEKELHKQFAQQQINKVNPRKEFFRVPITNLREQVEHMGLSSTWTIAAAAAEYRESLAIEKRLKESPDEMRDWLREQAEFEPVGELVLSEAD